MTQVIVPLPALGLMTLHSIDDLNPCGLCLELMDRMLGLADGVSGSAVQYKQVGITVCRQRRKQGGKEDMLIYLVCGVSDPSLTTMTTEPFRVPTGSYPYSR